MKNLITFFGNPIFKDVMEYSDYIFCPRGTDKMRGGGGCKNPLWLNWSGSYWGAFKIDATEDIVEKAIKNYFLDRWEGSMEDLKRSIDLERS